MEGARRMLKYAQGPSSSNPSLDTSSFGISLDGPLDLPKGVHVMPTEEALQEVM
jgi:hypothetical protein